MQLGRHHRMHTIGPNECPCSNRTGRSEVYGDLVVVRLKTHDTQPGPNRGRVHR